MESRVALGVGRLLDALARHQARATFFVLGWIADRHPDLVKSIAAAGHEVASHGWGHRRVTQLSPEAFREEVRTSRETLEQVVAAPVLGFRAPSYSIVPGLEWALEILVEEGYRYDSSLFPIRRPGYGYPKGGRDPYHVRTGAGEILEVPPATFRVLGANLPAAGGAYLRLLPFALIRAAVRQAERRGAAATLYVHPWEVDPEQPRLAVGAVTRLRHYGGLTRTLPRLERLLGEFRFVAVRDRLKSE